MLGNALKLPFQLPEVSVHEVDFLLFFSQHSYRYSLLVSLVVRADILSSRDQKSTPTNNHPGGAWNIFFINLANLPELKDVVFKGNPFTLENPSLWNSKPQDRNPSELYPEILKRLPNLQIIDGNTV